ncbi:MAG: regulatory iron-sulfur-containing complex subunit RicT [Propionicimonas sp.]|uniref:PSP1 domain-containing protein n=1 Tax=Propionicimonas sp. TaxID=1955623 RepID=UPI003D0E47E6
MPRVMAVAFEPLGRLHYLDPGAADYTFGQPVLVSTPEGVEVARCVWGPADVDWSGTLPLCLGAATPTELERDGANRRRRAEIAAVARRLISRRGLPMRVVGVDFVDQSEAFDQQAVVYYEAPGRVDFRELLTDLARTLQSRIDLRQVGARDAAALLGGLGPCGREVCCATMGPRHATLSGGLARDQTPLHSQSQLQGTCGRTMCCLAYESRLYADFRDRAPRRGAVVSTDEGTGVVVGHNVPLDAVVVQTETGRFTCPLGRVCPLTATSAD